MVFILLCDQRMTLEHPWDEVVDEKFHFSEVKMARQTTRAHIVTMVFTLPRSNVMVR